MSELAAPDGDLPLLSGRAHGRLKHAAAQMIAAFVLADGVAAREELDIVTRACADLGIDSSLFAAALAGTTPENAKQRFADCISAVTAQDDRELLATAFFEIASADEECCDREAAFLELLRNSWGVAVSFANKALVWDSAQLAVIERRRAAHTLVSAGPGMGKTAVACARVSHLIERQFAEPTNIWLISFTRTAVGELKARIADFAAQPDNAFNVKISTIDAQAWKIRYGFTADQARTLFGGFDTGIAEALALLDSRAADFKDAFADLEHVIVDEAQDIIGLRADFLLKVISLLPRECGVTVFHDPAQAIYDYALQEGSGTRFVDGLKAMLGDRLEPMELHKIHRTENRALLQLYEDLRIDILGNADVSSRDFRARTERVKVAATEADAAFDYRSLAEYSGALVLFRRRVEVTQASAFMAGARLPHRLRMSHMPRTIKPWVGLLLSGHTARDLSREQFIALAENAFHRADPLWFGGMDAETFTERSWELLTRYGSAEGTKAGIDLWKLRGRLSQSPPEEFLSPELGETGPILGTIHASKGREADHVILQINRNWGGDEESSDLAEESRVLFVGATRARKRLTVQGGLGLRGSTQLESGRCFRLHPGYKNGAQVQIGLQGDYDPWSIAAKAFDPFDLIESPAPFECTAVQERGTWDFRITDQFGRDLGCFNDSLNRDLFQIARKRNGANGRPPDDIRNLYVIGFTTIVAPPPGGPGGRALAAPFDQSGIWIAPQIVDFPLAFFKWRAR